MILLVRRQERISCFFRLRLYRRNEAHPENHAPGEEHAVLDTFSPCWMLNKEYQGKGYAYEAAKAFFDYLFYEKGARRIYAYTEDYNISSQRLCEKLGMRREGMFAFQKSNAALK